MHAAKFQLYKFTAIFPRFLKLLPKCHYHRRLSHVPQACLYHSGIKPNCIYERQQGRHEQTHVGDNHSILADKLKVCKTHLTNCVDPVKKYEYLADLRDQNVELYYHYLCNNTVEVFSVLTAVDGIADKFYRLGTILINRIRRNDVSVKPLDISSTVDLLRKKVNDQRGAQVASDVESTSKTEKIVQNLPLKNVVETLNPHTQFMIYLQAKHVMKK